MVFLSVTAISVAVITAIDFAESVYFQHERAIQRQTFHEAEAREEREIAAAQRRWNDFATAHPLGTDVRLHERLTIMENMPQLRHLLARLETATGLKFTLTDELADHEPNLGHLQLKNVRAYSVMEVIAERDLEKGRSEKTEKGYRLTGISKSFRALPQPSIWRLIGAIVLLAVGIGLGVLLYLRWRRNPSVADASGS